MEVAVNYDKIGEKIRERRTFLKMTQEKLANDVDVSASFISDIENGRRKMSLETMIKISIVLKTSLDYFILENVNSARIKNEIKIEELKNLLNPIDEYEQSEFLDFTLNSARYLASRKR